VALDPQPDRHDDVRIDSRRTNHARARRTPSFISGMTFPYDTANREQRVPLRYLYRRAGNDEEESSDREEDDSDGAR